MDPPHTHTHTHTLVAVDGGCNSGANRSRDIVVAICFVAPPCKILQNADRICNGLRIPNFRCDNFAISLGFGSPLLYFLEFSAFSLISVVGKPSQTVFMADCLRRKDLKTSTARAACTRRFVLPGSEFCYLDM